MFNSPAAASATPNVSTAAMLDAILQADTVSCEILRFLLKNENAMDSTKGIAAWWVHLDELAVQPSLHRLFACGAIVVHTLSSGTTLYGLTPDPDVRAWLRNALAIPNDLHVNGHRQPEQKKVPTGVSNT
jgi:hypothetical protein